MRLCESAILQYVKLFFRVTVQSTIQAIELIADFFQTFSQMIVLLFIQPIEVLGYDKEVDNFDCRTKGNVDKICFSFFSMP